MEPHPGTARGSAQARRPRKLSLRAAGGGLGRSSPSPRPASRTRSGTSPGPGRREELPSSISHGHGIVIDKLHRLRDALESLCIEFPRRKPEKANPAGFEWVHGSFREEMDRLGHHIGRGMRIKCPYVVPRQMKALKESAYSPQGHLYLGLNFRSNNNASHEEKNLTRLKANWANNYIRWRTKQGFKQDVAEIVNKGWNDFLGGLEIDVEAAVECYELGFHYVPALHREELKDKLAADALFLVIYMLYLSGDLPKRGFSWLEHDPQFRAASSHYYLHDLFLLENQVPLRVVEAVVQDFCKCRSPGGRSPEGLARPNRDFKHESQEKLKKLVQVVVDRRLKMGFPTSNPDCASFEVVYGWGSQHERSAGRQEGSSLGCPAGPPPPVVNIGRCDHLLDCLLEAICSRSELQPSSVTQGLNSKHGIRWDPEEASEDVSNSSESTTSPSSGGSWHRIQGWGFRQKGNFSSIRRVRPRGGYWYDVTKLRFLDAAGVRHLTREEIIKSMLVRGPPSDGNDDDDDDDDGAPLALRSPEGVAILDRQAARGLPELVGVADSLREHVESRSKTSRGDYNHKDQLLELVTELLLTVSPDSDDAQVFDKARVLHTHLGRFKPQLLEAIRHVDRDLRALSGLGHPPWARVNAYGLILSYFAETAFLLDKLSRVAEFRIQATRIDVTELRRESLREPMEQVLEQVKVVLEGLTARGYLTTTPPVGGEVTMLVPEPDDEELHKPEAKYEAQSVESATRLKRVGISLGLCDRVHQVHMDLQPDAVLKLPRLIIDDCADSLFRNLAVWERIKKPDQARPFACFIKLLDNLIDREEDVALMRQAGVIVHHLGSDAAVATMVNDLAVGLSFYSTKEWNEMLEKVIVRTGDTAKQYWAEFKDNYFSRPWHATATVAATLLLLLTIAQTVFSGLQVIKLPPK